MYDFRQTLRVLPRTPATASIAVITFFLAWARDDVGSNPRSEVQASTVANHVRNSFAREVLSRDLLQIGVDVGGRDIAAPSLVVHVLEELLAGQVAALPHDACKPAIVETDFMPLAALAAKLKTYARPLDIHVVVAQRRQTEERLVRAYSSLPTRISVRSRSRTTLASTFSRHSSRFARYEDPEEP